MSTTVVGLFDRRDTAEAAVRDLVEAGFESRQISVVAPNTGASGVAEEMSEGNLSGEGAATGLTSGAVVGGILGMLIGAGLIFVPAGVIAAGPIAGLVAGGAAGAATGGVLGGLVGLGIPENHADAYAESVRRGGTLVVVQAPSDRIDEAHRILDRDGAVDIEDKALEFAGDVRENSAGAARVRAFEAQAGGVSGAYADNPPPPPPTKNLTSDEPGLGGDTGAIDSFSGENI